MILDYNLVWMTFGGLIFSKLLPCTETSFTNIRIMSLVYKLIQNPESSLFAFKWHHLHISRQSSIVFECNQLRLTAKQHVCVTGSSWSQNISWHLVFLFHICLATGSLKKKKKNLPFTQQAWKGQNLWTQLSKQQGESSKNALHTRWAMWTAVCCLK